MAENNKAISPSEYRKKIQKERYVKTPTGMTFKIKKLSAIELLENGMEDIPNPFMQFIKDNNSKNLKAAMEDEKSLKLMLKFVETLVTKGILEPKVVLEYKKGEMENCLLWTELDTTDQAFLMGQIIGVDLKNV